MSRMWLRYIEQDIFKSPWVTLTTNTALFYKFYLAVPIFGTSEARDFKFGKIGHASSPSLRITKHPQKDIVSVTWTANFFLFSYINVINWNRYKIETRL